LPVVTLYTLAVLSELAETSFDPIRLKFKSNTSS